jgi:hypothetical protein
MQQMPGKKQTRVGETQCIPSQKQQEKASSGREKMKCNPLQFSKQKQAWETQKPGTKNRRNPGKTKPGDEQNLASVKNSQTRLSGTTSIPVQCAGRQTDQNPGTQQKTKTRLPGR